MSKYRMAQVSAVLNLLGSLLLLYSFQATSTNLLLVTTPTKAAFCIGNTAAFTVEGHLVKLGVDCPVGSSAKPAAVVNTDAPWAQTLGLVFIGAGFLLQLFSIEQSNLSSADIRTLRKARKLLEKVEI